MQLVGIQIYNIYIYLFIFIYVLISVLVRRGSDGKAELVLLDHGLYEYLPSSIRQPLCRLWKAIVTNSHADMMTYASELGVKGIVLKLIGPHIKENMIFVHMCCVAGKRLVFLVSMHIPHLVRVRVQLFRLQLHCFLLYTAVLIKIFH